MARQIRDRLLAFSFARRLDYWWRAQRGMHYKGEREIKLLKFIVDPRRNSVDVGANKGVYAYWLQKYSRHVFAYEPNPANFRYLSCATGNVTVFKSALSDKNGSAPFRIERVPRHKPGKSKKGEDFWFDDLGGSLKLEKVGTDYAEIPVETRRLDDENLEDIGFIKIDVEGHEFEVLNGARETLRENRPVLQIEIEERYNGRPIGKAVEEVEALGFKAFVFTPFGLKGFSEVDASKHFDWNDFTDFYLFNFLFFPA